MLSSGTLNLKFMQRKPNPNIKPKLEDDRNRAPEPAKPLQHSNRGSQAPRGQGTAPPGQSSSSSSTAITLDHRHQSSSTPTLTIVFEESLIGFPWLSCRRTTSVPSGPADAETLPAHTGRKSYGEFNKTVQKLDEEPSAAASNKRSQPESSTAHSSRSESKKPKIQSRQPPATSDDKGEGTRSGDKVAPRCDSAEDTKRVSKKKKTKKQEGEAEESARAFKKPFTATTIKTKRKTVFELYASTNDAGPSRTGTKKTTLETASSATSATQASTHDAQRRQQRQHQGRESIVIPDDHPGPAADDNEMVNRQIDLMFKEARKAQIT